MHANLDGTNLASRKLGDLVIFHLLIPTQYEDLALFFRQPEHCALEKHHLLFLLQFMTGKRRPALNITGRLFWERSFGLMGLVVVGTRVAGDVKHPSLEPAVVAKGLPVLEHPEEDVLDQVVRRRPAVRHANEEVE